MTEEGLKWTRSAWVFIGLISAAAGLAFVLLPPYLAQKGITDTGWMPITAAIALAMTALCCYSFFTSRPLYGAMSSVMFVFLMTLVVTVLPMASNNLQDALYKYSLYGKEKAGVDERIITYGLNKPSIVFYSEHKVAAAGGIDTLQKLIAEGRDRIVIAKARDTEQLKRLGLVVRDTDKGYVLLERN
jgi:amino acid transporter